MNYDIVIVGGGLGGSTLAKNLAERGQRVLVLEREPQFKDRVRGEQMHPWGVAAARALGVYDHMVRTYGNQTRWWITYVGGRPVAKRDLAQTTPHRVGSFNCYHPAMQEALFQLAQQAGAEVRRRITVDSVVPGSPPRVEFWEAGERRSLTARVVVGADGRNSKVRAWGGFTVNRDPDRLLIAGTLLEETPVPDDAVHVAVGPQGTVLIAPLGGQRARTYFMCRKSDGLPPLSGADNIPRFLSYCQSTGTPSAWFDQAQVTGPLAQFNAADHWVDHPARSGVALIGDAAAASDPCWGSGLSLTLWDVLHLRDALCSTPDREEALERYARAHDRHYGVMHRIEHWMAELVWSTGPAADERRARVRPHLTHPPAGTPDIIGLGPESPADEQARRFLLGED